MAGDERDAFAAFDGRFVAFAVVGGLNDFFVRHIHALDFEGLDFEEVAGAEGVAHFEREPRRVGDAVLRVVVRRPILASLVVVVGDGRRAGCKELHRDVERGRAEGEGFADVLVLLGRRLAGAGQAVAGAAFVVGEFFRVLRRVHREGRLQLVADARVVFGGFEERRGDGLGDAGFESADERRVRHERFGRGGVTELGGNHHVHEACAFGAEVGAGGGDALGEARPHFAAHVGWQRREEQACFVFGLVGFGAAVERDDIFRNGRGDGGGFRMEDLRVRADGVHRGGGERGVGFHGLHELLRAALRGFAEGAADDVVEVVFHLPVDEFGRGLAAEGGDEFRVAGFGERQDRVAQLLVELVGDVVGELFAVLRERLEFGARFLGHRGGGGPGFHRVRVLLE